MNLKKLPHILLFVFVFSLLIFSPVSAQEQVPTPSDDDVNDVARQMYCPVCENIPLDVCETTACEQWRELIREKLAAGWTDEQIKDYFVLQYGDRVLAEPPRRGFNWLVYILPPVFILVGAWVLYTVLRRMRRAAPADVPPGDEETESEPLDPYKARLEEALRERRK